MTQTPGRPNREKYGRSSLGPRWVASLWVGLVVLAFVPGVVWIAVHGGTEEWRYTDFPAPDQTTAEMVQKRLEARQEATSSLVDLDSSALLEACSRRRLLSLLCDFSA